MLTKFALGAVVLGLFATALLSGVAFADEGAQFRLKEAIGRSDIQGIKAALAEGADINYAAGCASENPLIVATAMADVKPAVVQFLIDHGAKPAAMPVIGMKEMYDPLNSAVDVLSVSLGKERDPNEQDLYYTPERIAEHKANSIAKIKILLASKLIDVVDALSKNRVDVSKRAIEEIEAALDRCNLGEKQGCSAADRADLEKIAALLKTALEKEAIVLPDFHQAVTELMGNGCPMLRH